MYDKQVISGADRTDELVLEFENFIQAKDQDHTMAPVVSPKETLRKNMSILLSLIENVESNELLEETNKEILKLIPKFTIPSREPANKKAEKQLRFFSTKKKRTNKRMGLCNPNSDEEDQIKKALLAND